MFKRGQFNELGARTPAFARYRSAAADDSRQEKGVSGLRPRVLVVDADITIRQQLEILCSKNGYTVEISNSVEQALSQLAKKDIDVFIIDIRFAELTGVELFAQLQRDHPDISTIVLGDPPIDYPIDAIKTLVSDYIIGPFTLDSLQHSIRAALDNARVFCEIRNLRRSVTEDGVEFGGLLSRTIEMRHIFETVRTVSPTNMTVLLQGEPGTGKELLARAIHYQSSRCQGPLITVNCAAFPESLLEIELFGCGDSRLAAEPKEFGKIKLANGGTLFLDEIENMAPFVQSKFLAFLESYSSTQLGREPTFGSDVRVIAATNVPVEDLVAQRKMRVDLYYRINVVPIQVMPLRERLEDIPILVNDFLHRHLIALQKGITGVSEREISRLVQYHWPGNLCELQNVLEKAIILNKGPVIESLDLPAAELLST